MSSTNLAGRANNCFPSPESSHYSLADPPANSSISSFSPMRGRVKSINLSQSVAGAAAKKIRTVPSVVS